MRIELPSVWEGEGTPKGKRKPVMMRLFDVIEVEIGEISEAQAPLCITSEYVDVRYYDDDFWYPVCTFGRYLNPGDDEPEHREKLKVLQNIGPRHTGNLVRHFENTFASTVFGIHYTDLWSSECFNPENFKQIDTSNRDKAMAKTKLLGENTVLIDGAVWVRSDEPVMKIAPRYQGNPDCDIVPLKEQGDGSRHGRVMIFDLGMDMDIVRRIAREHSVYFGDTTNLNIPEFEILMPEVMRNVANNIQLLRDANDAADRWWEKFPERLAMVDGRQLSALSELFELIQHLKAKKDSDRASELEEFIREIIKSGVVPKEIREKFDRALARFEEYMLNEDLEIDTPFGAAP